MKVKTTYSHIGEFNKYLLTSLASEAKTTDLLKEYLLAFAIHALYKQTKTKEHAADLNPEKRRKMITIQLDESQLVALSIYFNRYKLPDFLQPLEWQILNLIPGHLIKILKPNTPTTHEEEV